MRGYRRHGLNGGKGDILCQYNTFVVRGVVSPMSMSGMHSETSHYTFFERMKETNNSNRVKMGRGNKEYQANGRCFSSAENGTTVGVFGISIVRIFLFVKRFR